MSTLTAHAADWPNRPPSSHLSYNGDHRHLVGAGQAPLGPNTYGEYGWPVEAVYDDVADKTRVGLSNIAPPDAEDAPTFTPR